FDRDPSKFCVVEHRRRPSAREQQASEILEHLLEMRYAEIARRRVAIETAVDAIVHAAACHRVKGPHDHLLRAIVARPSPPVEEEMERVRLPARLIATEPTVPLVEA